jgi:transcriptional regulator with PAS, ATPase and Fis domain
MHVRSGDIHSSRGRASDAGFGKIDEQTLDNFLERMTEAKCWRLFQWARRREPELLKALIISFLTGDATQANVKKTESRGTTTLRESEQEHIARVISESETLVEAAYKLGIHDSTLWRKRKRYRLG